MKKKNLMTKRNLEKRLYEIEEQQRKEKAMEQAKNERNYNNYLRRKNVTNDKRIGKATIKYPSLQ